MKITAVIPAHNEEATIARTVESLLASQIDSVLVMADNCTDSTVTVAAAAGATVYETVDNKDKKAGALNQAMVHVDSDLVLVMDADTEIGPRYVETALDRLANNPSIGAVGGSFFAREENTLLQVMQGNEYARYVREISRRKNARANVLTGAGSIFRVSVLREVREAREAGRLPGTGIYSQKALTEDNELSLAIKSLGYQIVSPKDCEIYTDAPEGVVELFHQRVRWRRGAMEDLKLYGFSKVTAPYIFKMVWGFALSLLSIAYVALLVASPSIQFSLFWTMIMVIGVADKVWTIKKRDVKARMMALTVVPEILYDLFQQAVLMRALWDFTTRAPQKW